MKSVSLYLQCIEQFAFELEEVSSCGLRSIASLPNWASWPGLHWSASLVAGIKQSY